MNSKCQRRYNKMNGSQSCAQTLTWKSRKALGAGWWLGSILAETNVHAVGDTMGPLEGITGKEISMCALLCVAQAPLDRSLPAPLQHARQVPGVMGMTALALVGRDVARQAAMGWGIWRVIPHFISLSSLENGNPHNTYRSHFSKWNKSKKCSSLLVYPKYISNQVKCVS